MVPALLQVLFAQQGPPALPQTLQVPVELVPELISQAVPGSLHPTVVLHEDAEQQGWPVAPHSLQAYPPAAPSYRHCAPASVHRLSLQHGPPTLPQDWHVAVEFVLPSALHVRP